MVSFRKLFPVLAVIGLLLATGTASAQVQNCSATALTPLVRVEGLTEPVGRITITCDVAPGTSPTLFFKLNSNGPDFTNTISSGSASTKTVTAAAIVNGDFTAPKFGTLVSAKEIDFNGIALGASATTVSVVIDNVRVNASQAAKNTTIGMSITGTAVAAGSTQTLLILSASKDVASVQQGLTFSVTAGTALSQCDPGNTTAPTTSSTGLAALKFTPGFAFAFRGGTSNATQEPTDAPVPPYSAATAATLGLQLEARFSNVPAGAVVYVQRVFSACKTGGSTSTPGDCSQATYYTTATTQPTGAFVKITPDASGNASAVWTVTDINLADPTAPFTFNVGLVQAASGTQIAVTPTMQVSGNLAPRSSVTSATSDKTVDVPRFVDTTGTPSNLISVNPCATTLLFPYMTNGTPFDTGLAVSNTSKDFKSGDTFLFSGTDKELTGQPGICTLNFFGTGLPDTTPTTASIAPGKYSAFMLSSVAPGFTGYMVAQCNFVNAHGFAFITDGKGNTMGYNALVIPRGSRSATGAGTNAETLGQ